MKRSRANRQFRPRAARQAAGFTLLESLIAFLVLAIGLLGLAGLQIQGMRFNYEAYARSQATFLAYDMLERMRLNRVNVADYAGPLAVGVCDAVANDNAMNDRVCWADAVRATLPGAQLSRIDYDNVTQLATVSLQWTDRNTGFTKLLLVESLVPPVL